MDDLKIALLGFGHVGQALARILLDKEADIRQRYGRGIRVTGIATRSRGSLYDPAGLDLRKALEDMAELDRFSPDHPASSSLDSMGLVEQGDYQVLLELATLNIRTGQPATDHLRGAFLRGRHGITANKGPLAWHYRSLKELAEEKGVCFFFESTVMDGTPLFNLVDHTLKMCQISQVSGILNATTNVVLRCIEEGLSYEEALEEGRRMGIVEADPSMDLEGHDPTAKIIAMTNVLMDCDLTPDLVDRQGILELTPEEIRAAHSRGNRIKLFCQASRQDGGVSASVLPVEVPGDSIFARVEGAMSAYSLVTDYMGTLTVIEHDVTPLQTGYGVFADLLRVLESERCQP